MVHKSINYDKWDNKGIGINILEFLNEVEQDIWAKALPFQDSRKGEAGHGEIATYFSLKLTELLKGNRNVTISSTILHDIGWSILTETERKLFYEEETDYKNITIWRRYESILRARHQEQGVLKAKEILEAINYNKNYIPEILEIISQHDTRKGFLNINDKIVRDSDKLWRYTYPHGIMVNKERGWPISELKSKMENDLKRNEFFSCEISEQIARIEMNATLEYLANS